MEGLPMIVQGCKLARELEGNLNHPVMAGNKTLLLDSCVEIVNAFSNAVFELDPEHPFAYFHFQASKKLLIDAGQSSGMANERVTGSSSIQQPVVDLLPVQSMAPREIGVSVSSGRRSRKRKDSKEKECYRVPAQGNSEAPPDKYVWRKYGQKEILGSKFPRSYYRCTHSKIGCEAKKQVQRSDEDYYTFQVTYTGSHTCQATLQTLPQPSDITIDPSLLLSQLIASSVQFSSSTVEGFGSGISSDQRGGQLSSIINPFLSTSIPFERNRDQTSTAQAAVKELDNPEVDLEDVMFYFPNTTSHCIDAIFTSKS